MLKRHASCLGVRDRVPSNRIPQFRDQVEEQRPLRRCRIRRVESPSIRVPGPRAPESSMSGSRARRDFQRRLRLKFIGTSIDGEDPHEVGAEIRHEDEFPQRIEQRLVLVRRVLSARVRSRLRESERLALQEGKVPWR